VIGFGVLAFMMALAYRTYNVVGSDDLDDMVATDAQPRQSRSGDTETARVQRLEVALPAEDVAIGQEQR
jgi:hypothetical protein